MQGGFLNGEKEDKNIVKEKKGKGKNTYFYTIA